MTTREALQRAAAAHTKLAKIAKDIDCDASTIQKFARGDIDVSPQMEEVIRIGLRRIKEMWEEIDL